MTTRRANRRNPGKEGGQEGIIDQLRKAWQIAAMARMAYHVLNRGHGRAEVFHKEGDYAGDTYGGRSNHGKHEGRIVINRNHLRNTPWRIYCLFV